MQVNYVNDRLLSPKALDLVQFDQDSIRQTAAGQEAKDPTLYVADPERYEKNGRVLRDSERPRLLAYSPADNTLYANDGCNSCVHRLPITLKSFSEDQLRAFADDNNVPRELLERVAALVSET